MFIIVIGRSGATHIVDYQIRDGFRSICGKVYSKSDKVNTLAADNIFDGICKTCSRIYADMYTSDLEHDPRMARNNFQQTLYSLLRYHKVNICGPQSKYSYCFGRNWVKLVKAKRALSKNNKYYEKRITY